MKKTLAVLLCAALVLSFSAVAFADPDETDSQILSFNGNPSLPTVPELPTTTLSATPPAALSGSPAISITSGTAPVASGLDVTPLIASGILDKYTDCDKDAWYADGLTFCVMHGLMNGTSDTTIEPNRDITRAEIVSILYRLADQPAIMNDNVFTDVPAGSWYEAAVVWAQGKGIVKGITETTFEPTAPISREALVTMLFNYMIYDTKEKGGNLNLFYPNLALTYADNDQISDWATSALRWATAEKLVGGKDNNMFDPKGNTKRCEAAAIFQRLGKIPTVSLSPVGDPLVGGFTPYRDNQALDLTKIPERAKEAFEKATDGLDGANYTPVAYLSSQVVAGSNYTFLCLVKPVVPNAAATLKLVTIYYDLSGNAKITSAETVTDEANFVAADQVQFPSAGLAGGHSYADAVGGMASVEYGTAGSTEKYGLQASAKEAFDAAAEGLTGVGYEPLLLYSTQVVAGTNYRILCKATLVSATPATALCFVDVYAGVDGTRSMKVVGSFAR